MRAKGVISSNIQVVQGSKARCRYFASRFGISIDDTPLRALEIHEDELLGYERSLKGIAEQSERSSDLVRNPYTYTKTCPKEVTNPKSVGENP